MRPNFCQGRTGDKGDDGEKGEFGDFGPAGYPGKPGVEGMNGLKGAKGAPGLTGSPGFKVKFVAISCLKYWLILNMKKCTIFIMKWSYIKGQKSPILKRKAVNFKIGIVCKRI